MLKAIPRISTATVVAAGLVLSVALAPAPLLAAAKKAPASAKKISARKNDAADAMVVRTGSGLVRGVLRDGVREFLGVPYAVAPTGALRWKAPQAHPPWTETLDASNFGPACPQTPPFGMPTGPTSEDCLNLNIYTPNPPTSGLPVMMWIHGGSFVFGTGATYNGSALAAKGKMVVVTINYRLGALGFLAHRGLDAETPDHSSGGWGLLDQQAALRWVQNNIRAFGGDPHKVTAAGESAGGISVCLQLVAPAAAGLFQRAIIESGPCLRQRPLAEAETHGDEFAAKLGCDKTPDALACMRGKSAQEVLGAISSSGGLSGGPPAWTPVMDGHLVPMQPEDAFAAGKFNKMPVLNGSNHDEGTVFLAFAPAPTATEYAARTRALLGKDADRVLAAYPLSNYSTSGQASATAFGDSFFSCQIRKASRLLAAQVPTYAYEFNDRNPPSRFGAYAPFAMGAFHGSEIGYVFQARSPLMQSDGVQMSEPQNKLSEQMLSYWSSFIGAGNFDGATPPWGHYQSGADNIMSLAPDGIGYEKDFAKQHHCDLWDTIRPQ